jgi:L-ribulokinase
MSKFTIGLDFGTNSVRAVIVRVEDGEEVATSVWNYKRGEDGVIVDPKTLTLPAKTRGIMSKGLKVV